MKIENKSASFFKLQKKVFSYVNQLLNEELPVNHTFHNWQHTYQVVGAVQQIAESIQLLEDEREIVLLAAWFHDTGHIFKCFGHEEESKTLAKMFLLKNRYPLDKIARVMACIDATKIPQSPKDTLGEILCDGDLYHLSIESYLIKLQLLRDEWSLISKINYSDRKWWEMNLTFLEAHQYFTPYGKEVLEKGKQKNVELIKKQILQNEQNII